MFTSIQFLFLTFDLFFLSQNIFSLSSSSTVSCHLPFTFSNVFCSSHSHVPHTPPVSSPSHFSWLDACGSSSSLILVFLLLLITPLLPSRYPEITTPLAYLLHNHSALLSHPHRQRPCKNKDYLQPLNYKYFFLPLPHIPSLKGLNTICSNTSSCIAFIHDLLFMSSTRNTSQLILIQELTRRRCCGCQSARFLSFSTKI